MSLLLLGQKIKSANAIILQLKTKLKQELTMDKDKGLVDVLKAGFNLHGSRLSFMSCFIKALINLSSELGSGGEELSLPN